MGQRGYAVAFGIVFLAGCLGAFLGGRLLWQNLQGNARPSGAWTPPPAAGTRTPGPANDVAQITITAEARGRAPTATAPSENPAAGVEPAVTPFPSPTPTPFESPTATPVATGTATPTPLSGAYVPMGAVRNTEGDCAGRYVLGRVTDAAGKGLPDVRLLLVDEYGNAEAKLSKSAASEAGRYDFPLFGAPRRFYLAIVDPNGEPLSARVEVDLREGQPGAKMSCHWVDWQKR